MAGGGVITSPETEQPSLEQLYIFMSGFLIHHMAHLNKDYCLIIIIIIILREKQGLYQLNMRKRKKINQKIVLEDMGMSNKVRLRLSKDF